MEALELLRFIFERRLEYANINKGNGREVVLFIPFCDLYEFAKLIRADREMPLIMVSLKGTCIGIELRDICESASDELADIFGEQD